jgi:catechol 2,3-dioxygenase
MEHTMSTETAVSQQSAQPSVPAGTHIGHVHLKVADLDRAIQFYRDFLGFDLLYTYGTAAFLSAGGYHHHIALNTWESKNGQPPKAGSTGLYHFAINYPTRRDLAIAYKRLLDSGWDIDGYNDHGTHIALYLHDPDHNGIELAWDRDPSEWPQWQGVPNDVALQRMRDGHRRLDLKALLAEAEDPVITPAE